MNVEIVVDAWTRSKLDELGRVYGCDLRETLNMAYSFYEWFIKFKTGWSVAKIDDEKQTFVPFLRDPLELALSAPVEVRLEFDLPEAYETEITRLLHCSHATNLSAMTVEAIWLLTAITDATKEGKRVGVVDEVHGVYRMLDSPALTKIRP